jgi:hypothetical protein
MTTVWPVKPVGIVPKVQRGDPGRERARSTRAGERRARGVPVDPWGRSGLEASCRCGLPDGTASAQGIAFELDPVSGVDDAVEDGVGKRRVADHLMPSTEGELAGDDQRASVVAIIDDLEEITPLLGIEGLGPPVVEDQQPGALAIKRGSRPSPRAWARSANRRGVRL